MTKSVEIHDLAVNEDGSVFMVFMHPDPPPGSPEESLPIGHFIPADAFTDRAARHGYDPEHPDFHQQVVEHCLHEAHTPVGVHTADKHAQRGQLHDRAAADNHIVWKFTEEHQQALRGIGVTSAHVEKRRRAMLPRPIAPYESPSPPPPPIMITAER